MYPFFFQAEDGIRDGHVTGVQTCALPIFGGRDGLQTRYTGSQYHHPGRSEGARSGHHHGHDSLILISRVEHGTVTGQITLGAEYVHGLGAGDRQSGGWGREGGEGVGGGTRG